MALGLVQSHPLAQKLERFTSREPRTEGVAGRTCIAGLCGRKSGMKVARSMAALNKFSMTSIGGHGADEMFSQSKHFVQRETSIERMTEQRFLAAYSRTTALSSRSYSNIACGGKSLDLGSRTVGRAQLCSRLRSDLFGYPGSLRSSKLTPAFVSIAKKGTFNDAMWVGDVSRRASNFAYDQGRMSGVAKQLQSVLRREDKIPSTWDVVGLGQAMVDFSGMVDDDFLVMLDLEKGSRKVVDLEERGRVLKELDGRRYKLRAGGSLSNTLSALATLGAASNSLGAAPTLHVGMCGGVGGDPLGEFYRSKLLKTGVRFLSSPIADGSTGTVIVLTTPDAQRTMLAYQGNSSSVSLDASLMSAVARTRVFMAEGYLLEVEAATEAVLEACATAHAAGAIVAVTASDVSCVHRHLPDFWRLIGGTADILFSNSDEARALAGLSSTACPSLAAAHLSHFTRLVSVTDGARGSYLACRGRVVYIHPPSCTPVDTCGAGDAYAAGLLYAILRGKGAEVLLNGPAQAYGSHMAAVAAVVSPAGDDVAASASSLHQVSVEEAGDGELVLELLRSCGVVAAKVAATVVTQQGSRLKDEDAVRLVQAFGAMPCMEGRWMSGEGSKHPFGMGIGI